MLAPFNIMLWCISSEAEGGWIAYIFAEADRQLNFQGVTWYSD